MFEDLQLFQTGLSSFSDNLFNVVEGLPNPYANLTSFTHLSEGLSEGLGNLTSFTLLTLHT